MPDNETEKWVLRTSTVEAMEEGRHEVRKPGEYSEYHTSFSRYHHGVQLVELKACLQERSRRTDASEHGQRVRHSDDGRNKSEDTD